METPTKRKPLADGLPEKLSDSLKMIRLISFGGYNRVYETNDPSRVLRVFSGSSEDRIFMARRAEAFHQLFYAHRDEMGPSNLRVFSGLVRQGNNEWVIEMEYLKGGLADRVVNDAQQIDVNLFCLTWWLERARALKGFVHGDLKPQNIMYRTYEKPQTICFEDYVLENVDMVPVVIDFESGRLRETRRHRMDTHLTAIYRSPELAIKEFVQPDTHPNPDWWGLGITCLYWLSAETGKLLLAQIGYEYAVSCNEALKDHFESWEDFDFLEVQTVLYACIFNYVVNDAALPPRNRRYIDASWYKCFIEGKEELIRKACLLSSVQRLREDVRARMPSVLKKLLSWDPHERILSLNDFEQFRAGDSDDDDRIHVCDQSYQRRRDDEGLRYVSPYMTCLVCGNIAHQACGIGQCLTLYCSDSCAQVNWQKHKHE